MAYAIKRDVLYSETLLAGTCSFVKCQVLSHLCSSFDCNLLQWCQLYHNTNLTSYSNIYLNYMFMYVRDVLQGVNYV